MSQSADSYLTQPPVGTPVDYGNPIANGLWCNYLFNEKGGKKVFDSGNMNAGELSFNGTDPVWSEYGLIVGNGKGYVNSGSGVYSAFNPVRGSHTVRVVHIPRTWTGGFTAIIDTYGLVGSTRILNIFADTSGNISYRGIGGSDGSATANSVGMALGQVNDLVWVRAVGDGTSGSPTSHFWYLNGTLKHTENGLTTTLWPSNGYDMSVGGNPTGGGTAYDGEYLIVQCWDRALSDTEIAWLAANPYGIMSDGPFRILTKVFPSATATVADIPTIYLTSPSVNAAGIVSATANASIGTITLTVPTMVAGQSMEAVFSDTLTVTLTAPTVTTSTPDNTATVSLIGIVSLTAPTVSPIGTKPPNNYQQQFYWGRFSRGQYVNVILDPLYLSDSVPVARFWLNGSTKVKQVSIPVSDPDQATFGIPVLIDQDFTDGHYLVAISFVIDRLPYTVVAYMEVIGGSPQAPVTSTLEIDRTNGRALVYGDESGYIRMGYSPSLSGELE